MNFVAFGINHKTASVDIREKVSFSPEIVVDAIQDLKSQTQCTDAVIISTCNRTEIYAQGKELQSRNICDWLGQFHCISPGDVHAVSYQHYQLKAVEHLMKVASGLDSLVLGEPQILGQVKQAFTYSRNAGAVTSSFERLFQQTFSVAKKVRSETDIGANAVSVAFASVQLAKQIFGSLETSHVLVIGAGETIELVTKHLTQQSVGSLTVANRTLDKARTIAEPLGAQVITLSQIPARLAQADIVISSTASQLPILGKGMVESAIKERRHKPMFLVDLAVPRDIENEVGDLSDAYLYTVDDLQQIVAQNMATRQEAAEQGYKIVLDASIEFGKWRQAQGSLDAIKQYRQKSESLSEKLVDRAKKQIIDGKPIDDVLQELVTKMCNSLIHGPTKALNQAAELDDQTMLRLLSDALGIQQNNK